MMTLIAILLNLSVTSIVPSNVASVVPAKAVKAQCETYAPNLDGISITVCGGSVVSRCDSAGNCLFSAETY